MTTTTFPSYLDALKTALEARPGLANVVVASAPLAKNATAKESIEFVGCESRVDWGTTNRQQNETYLIDGVIVIIKPGAGEAKAKEARDRVNAILSELKTQLTENPSLGLSAIYIQGRVSFERWTQTVNDKGRICAVLFRIEVQARI